MSNKAELDRVMLDCLSQTDEEKLAENFVFITQSFHDEAVYVPLTVTNKLGIMRSDMTGMDLATGQDSMDVSGITWAE